MRAPVLERRPCAEDNRTRKTFAGPGARGLPYPQFGTQAASLFDASSGRLVLVLRNAGRMAMEQQSPYVPGAQISQSYAVYQELY